MITGGIPLSRPSVEGVEIEAKIVRIDETGTAILRDDPKPSLLGKNTVNGLYRVHCKGSDLDAVFLACFNVAHIELF